MIRKLSAGDGARAREIWKACFEDSDAFLDAYFREAACIWDSFGYEENGRLIADLFMLKFHAKLAGKEYVTDFLAGCATMPEARKRGLMRELVRHAMMDMRARGLACVYLHPFLHAFYRRFGFETVAYIKRHTLMPDKVSNEFVITYASMNDLPIKKMEEAYAWHMESFDNCFLRTHERFCAWLSLLFADGGCVAVYDDGEDFSYALFFRDGGTANVFELVHGRKSTEMVLNGIEVDQVNYFLPSAADAEGSEEFTMMRVLDPVRLLKQARPVKDEFVIRVVDEFMGDEYRLAVRGDENGNFVFETDGRADVEASPEELAAMLAGTGKTFLFGKQNACFFETY